MYTAVTAGKPFRTAPTVFPKLRRLIFPKLRRTEREKSFAKVSISFGSFNDPGAGIVLSCWSVQVAAQGIIVALRLFRQKATVSLCQ